jgi:PTS system mannitol-specific IIC component
MFESGLVSPASPGSIFAVLLMTPKASFVGVILSVIASAGVSFFVASLLMKTQKQTDDSEDSLEAATSAMQGMKASSKGAAALNLADVKKIIVACDAGMGSSAMGAGLLRKKVEAANLDIEVTNLAINNLPCDVDIVVTHKDLTDRARNHAADAKHISLSNFLDNALYDNLVSDLVSAKQGA